MAYKESDKRTCCFAILHLKRIAILFVCFALTAGFLLPGSSHALDSARDTGKTVRVGWYESPFNMIDELGRRSGYAYEYQRKIAAYTGWNYEYVEGTWSQLMQKLENGEIDLMSDVSYVEDRTKDMLYASLPMGTEAYYVYTASDNMEITSDNYASLNGKKIGVTKDSIQKGIFLDWAKKHGIKPGKLVETTDAEEVSLAHVTDGSLDAFVTLDVYGDPEISTPVCKVGSSDFYFAVSKDREDLRLQLDAAMNSIQDENKYYNQQLTEQYLNNTTTAGYLSVGEKEWLADHGTIRVGYQDDYMAFCATDKDGELTGALKDYLEYASTSLENVKLEFEPVAYPTASDAIEAVKKGEVDCMFPANLTAYDGEALGVAMTPALMRTEMDAVVREDEQKEFIRKKDVTVAVNKGNTNYELYLKDHYPAWKIAYFPDTPAGLEAVAEGKADCIIISNYRFSNISRQCEKLHLTTVDTGVVMDYYFAANEGETELYSILTRVADSVPESITNASLTYYSTEDVKIGFLDYVKDHLGIAMTVIALILLVILLLLIRSIRMERKAREEEHLVNDLNKRVFVDPLTSVRNKGAFHNYIQHMQDRIDQGEQPEFAIGIFDCDNLKEINDQYGHDKGDEYLKMSTHMICTVFQHSPVFRIGGDEFAVVLQNEDYQNREELIRTFEETQKEKCAAAENKWEEVHMSMGIAVHDPEIDAEVNDTARRADQIMYENKRRLKGAY